VSFLARTLDSDALRLSDLG